MPIILDPDGYDLWLDPGMKDVAAASDLLKPYDARLMRCYPISTRINHVAARRFSADWSILTRLVCFAPVLFRLCRTFIRRRPLPTNPAEHWEKAVSADLGIQNKPQRTIAETAAHWTESIPAIEAQAADQFRFRILVVDDQYLIRETARQMLEGGGYEVLTAADGLDGLHALSRSLPDLIISDLNMPRMSGFEFLAVVRERFPHIATIAVSGEYITSGNPSGVVADAFFQKGHYTLKELCGEVAKLLAASPIRSESKKSEIAPLFVPRDNAGYLIIACPKCLRANRLEAMTLNGGLHETTCQSCGTSVKFEINHEIEPLMKRNLA